MFAHLWYWIEVHTGTVNESGPYYGFWSGFGSDIAEVALIGGLIHMARARNCDVTGCLRLKSYMVDGTPWKACKKHHPHIDEAVTRVTPERIATYKERHP